MRSEGFDSLLETLGATTTGRFDDLRQGRHSDQEHRLRRPRPAVGRLTSSWWKGPSRQHRRVAGRSGRQRFGPRAGVEGAVTGTTEGTRRLRSGDAQATFAQYRRRRLVPALPIPLPSVATEDRAAAPIG